MEGNIFNCKYGLIYENYPGKICYKEFYGLLEIISKKKDFYFCRPIDKKNKNRRIYIEIKIFYYLICYGDLEFIYNSNSLLNYNNKKQLYNFLIKKYGKSIFK